MNILNPPYFHTYSPRNIHFIANTCNMDLDKVIIKKSHVLPFLLPFNKKLSCNISNFILRIDKLNLLSFGNYYVLKLQV